MNWMTVMAGDKVIELHRNEFWNEGDRYNKITFVWEISSCYLERGFSDLKLFFFKIISNYPK